MDVAGCFMYFFLVCAPGDDPEGGVRTARIEDAETSGGRLPSHTHMIERLRVCILEEHTARTKILPCDRYEIPLLNLLLSDTGAVSAARPGWGRVSELKGVFSWRRAAGPLRERRAGMVGHWPGRE